MSSDKPLSHQDLQPILRRFLVDFPLLRKLTLDLSEPVMLIQFPDAISAACDDALCSGEPATTWSRVGQADSHPGVKVSYRCVHCNRSVKAYWIASRVTVASEVAVNGRSRGWTHFILSKIGQDPPWSIEPPKDLKRGLDAQALGLYKKALICMSQGYGIGALSYFRRVVEDAVTDLLTLVEEAAEADGDPIAAAAVKTARESKIADEKLKLVVDVVPASLRPGNVNPLGKLFDDYSRGMHSLSDEECLSIASDMREAIEYLFGSLRDRLEQAKAYRAKITRPAKSS